MVWRVFRLLAMAVVALQLGACINTDYDLGSTLTPEFPIKPGNYKDVSPNAPETIIVARKLRDAYRVYNRRTKSTNYARLYRIPEFSDYVLQYYDRARKPIVFLFLKPTEKGFDIYDIERLAYDVPEHLVGLLKPITDDDQKNNNINLLNGKRDTLYVIREMTRAKRKMVVVASYERQP